MRGKEGGGVGAQGREKVPGFSDSCSFGLLLWSLQLSEP